MNEKGMFKTQRGGTEQISIKYQVPWPQNFVLAGTSKTRVSYDSLSIFQWVAGICTIMREDTSVKSKKGKVIAPIMDNSISTYAVTVIVSANGWHTRLKTAEILNVMQKMSKALQEGTARMQCQIQSKDAKNIKISIKCT